MAATIENRPFDNFKLAITEPYHFFGRKNLLSSMKRSPFQVRILLGGRRLGKTSALNAVRWSLLDSCNGEPYRAFPVLLDLQKEQPKSLDNFRYLLIARLKEAIKGLESRRFQHTPLVKISELELGVEEIKIFGLKIKLGGKFNATDSERKCCLSHDEFRQRLLRFIRQLQTLNFEGVCFLLDGSEFIVCQDWANDTWSYLRGLKDTDTALKPFLGFLLSGYRDLKDYQQRVGSPLLNIAEIEWLGPLTESETRTLISCRCECESVQLTEQEINTIIEWAGCHPYLTHQMLNAIFDNRRSDKLCSFDDLIRYLIRKVHDKDFSAWWDGTKRSYGLSENEQAVYLELVEKKQETIKTLAQQVHRSVGEVEDSLEVLAGMGVIWQLDEERYVVGAKLFERWVSQERC